MISEQRIIQLAKFHANEVYEDYAGFTFKQLQEFANALHAEWIKSLGEPKAYAAFADNGSIRIWTCKKGESKRLSEQVGEELEALYALPNEEVK